MPFVVDASLALAWFFSDEQTSRTIALLDRIEDDPPVVPSIWHAEMLNAVRSAVVRRRITPEAAMETAAEILALVVVLEPPAPDRLKAALSLALENDLSVYDACYLDLCRHRMIPLATNDRDLVRAAGRLGVAVL